MSKKAREKANYIHIDARLVQMRFECSLNATILIVYELDMRSLNIVQMSFKYCISTVFTMFKSGLMCGGLIQQC